MILVDMSQIQIANLMVGVNTYFKGMNIDEGLLRHMTLNSLRGFRSKYGGEYGELVLCYDSKSWRKETFVEYKANRKKSRDTSGLDWNQVYETFGQIENELRENFPYACVRANHAEADDIIGALVIDKCRIVGGEKVLIISGDKDFIQLHDRGDVTQWSPTQKKMIKHNNPSEYLREHILRGDSSDGVPNVLSDDDAFSNPDNRQKPLRKKLLENYMRMDMTNQDNSISDTVIRNYFRNKQMIDLEETPEEIRKDILTIYTRETESARARGRKDLYNYFVKNSLVNLLDVMDQF